MYNNTKYIRKYRRKLKINEAYTKGQITDEEREKLTVLLDLYKGKGYKLEEEVYKLRSGIYRL